MSSISIILCNSDNSYTNFAVRAQPGSEVQRIARALADRLEIEAREQASGTEAEEWDHAFSAEICASPSELPAHVSSYGDDDEWGKAVHEALGRPAEYIDLGAHLIDTGLQG